MVCLVCVKECVLPKHCAKTLKYVCLIHHDVGSKNAMSCLFQENKHMLRRYQKHSEWLELSTWVGMVFEVLAISPSAIV